MKKKVDAIVLNESCCIMNIPKTLSRADGNHLSNIFEDSKNSLRNTITPPQSILGSPSKIKCEQENSSDQSDGGNLLSDKVSPPPPSTLGPGAEIKGKICHPIPSSSGGIQLDELKSFDEIGRSASSESTSSGGRLAFFKEGKLLLELSHRTEQGSWVQVKSKTYWPPPSTTTTTTTIQHPLQQDTPTNHSDDCSSINSSPWASEHIRKQLGPNPRNKIWVSTDHLFYMKLPSHIRDIRKRVRLRRNPYNSIPTMLNFNIYNNSGENCTNSGISAQHALVKDMKFIDRKKRLERTVSHLAKKLYFKLDDSISIHSLYEQVTTDACENASLDTPAFITPRKRYLKTLETDIDSHLRKKAHSGSNLVSIPGLSSPQLTKHCDNKLSFPSVSSPSSPLSLYAVPKSANGNNSQITSAYTIDSLLSSESSSEYSLQKNNSFLKTLLKHEKPLPSSSLSSHTKHGSSLPVRDRSTPEVSNRFHPLKRLEKEWEKGVVSSPSPKDVFGLNDPKATNSTESYDLTSSDLSSVVRFTSPHPFFNPYFDPRYIGFSPFSSTTPPPSSFLPGTASQQSNDVASAVAVAAAAAAGYPITPLHLPGLTASLALGVYPPVTLTPPFIRSPNPSPSSPLPIPHSPSPKLSPATPALPRSPRFEIAPSSQDVWAPSVSSSHQKLPNTPSMSPPPQDVPLNLSKPKHNC